MIVGIKGILHNSTPLCAIINVGGVFYEVNIPISTAEKLPKNGQEVFLNTVAIYREDSQALYGFASLSDRDFFKTLIEKVSGIGPKTAINIMSRMSADTLRSAIASADVALLSKCPGIGKKTAERLIVELKDASFTGNLQTSAIAQSSAPSVVNDAVATLIALGFKPIDADKAVHQALAKLADSASVEDVVKACLSR